MNIIKHHVSVGIICLIVWFLFIQLVVFSSYPRQMYFTEATLNWRVQNLIQSGKDEFGRSYPLLFSNWLDFEPPVLTYVFMAIRLVDRNEYLNYQTIASFIGVFFITGLFLFTKQFLKKTTLAFTVAVIASISPWVIIFSRFPNAEMLALVFIIWGFFFMTKKSLIPGTLLIILGGLSSKELYPAVLFIPIVMWLLTKNKLVVFVITSALLVFLGFFLTVSGSIQSIKDHQLSLFYNNSYLDNLNVLRGQYLALKLPSILGAVFFNKLQLFIVILRHFFETVSLPFLFSNRVLNYRQTVFNFGPLYMIWLPTFLFGGYYFLKQKTKETKVIILLLIIATLPDLCTVDSFDVSKSVLVFIPILILVGYGVFQFSKKWQMAFWIVSGLSFLMFAQQALLVPNPVNSTTADLIRTIKEKVIGKNLTYLPTHDPIKTIWLTDSIDPNPGPMIADTFKSSYTESNLNTGKIGYKGWVSKINNISIGNADQLKSHPEEFDIVIISAKEKEWFHCPTQLFTVGEGKKTYYVYERCTQKL